MGEIRGNVSDQAEARFRELAMKKFGYHKGSISKALDEAVKNWVNKNDTEPSAPEKKYSKPRKPLNKPGV